MSKYVVCALYKFVILEDYQQLKAPLLQCLLDNSIKGTLLLAKEGINGTVAGERKAIDTLLAWLRKDSRFARIVNKESFADSSPFYRTKVKLKKEIVTMGVENIDPNHIVGTYVQAKDWNTLISDPEVLLIDTRNDYEFSIGTFKNAINPETETFRQFPDYVQKSLHPEKHKKVAMFCTGGIRCEKSTAFLKQQGFEDVYHLDGGILKYLEEVPEEKSLWRGDCFVFDNRVTVNHQLEKGEYDQCYACRMPITETDKQHQHYQQGISCHHCYDKTTTVRKQRFQQREIQVQLAKQRGEQHLGGDMEKIAISHREAKMALKEDQRKAKESDAPALQT
jgi:UPF0176 protein